MGPHEPRGHGQSEEQERDGAEGRDRDGERQQRERDHRHGEGQRVGVTAPDEEAEPLSPSRFSERRRVVRGLALQNELAGQPVVVEIVCAQVQDQGPERPTDERYRGRRDRQRGDLPRADLVAHGHIAQLVEVRHRKSSPSRLRSSCHHRAWCVRAGTKERWRQPCERRLGPRRKPRE